MIFVFLSQSSCVCIFNYLSDVPLLQTINMEQLFILFYCVGVGMEVVRVVEWWGGVFVRVHSSV